MLDRESLWRRWSGAGLWGPAWALAAACSVPWLLPEAWSGEVVPGLQVLGWAAVLATAPFALRRRGNGVALAAALAWGVLGALAGEARREAALPEGFQEVRGRVATPWTLRGRSLRAEVAGTGPLEGLRVGVSVPARSAPPPGPGTPVVFRGALERVAPAPAFLAERPLWRARDAGPARFVRLASGACLAPLGPPRPGPLLRLRAWVRSRFEALPLRGPGRDLWGAMALAIPPASPEAFTPFAESGTVHVLVVSGLHLTLVMGAAEALWRRLRGPGGAWAAAGAGLAYALATGLSAPVWRGLLMGFAWAAGRATGWKAPPVLALHGALAAWILIRPASGCDPGFLLSWGALAGLLWAREPVAGLLGPLAGRWADPAAALLAPWLSTLPLLAVLHGGAPLGGPLANLLVLPLVSCLVPACLLLTLAPAPGLVEALGAVLGWLGGTLVPAFARITPLATGWLPPWLALGAGWLLLGQAASAFRRTRALAAALVLGSLLLLARGGTGAPPATFSLEAIDVGQGDAILVRAPGGEATLVDAGPDPWAARRIVRVLSRRGVREPVHLVLTHPHLDHAGGWMTLARLWPLASVARPAMAAPPWVPFQPPGPDPRSLARGAAWTRGAAAFSVRWPPGPLRLPDVNMNSLVLRIRWGAHETWLMGDALALQEADLLDLGDPGPGPPHRLLKAGHHGSRSATGRAWAEALGAPVVLVTAGRGNRFGHPHAATLDTLAGAQVFVTGDSLGVRAEAVPGGWLVSTGRGWEGRLTGWTARPDAAASGLGPPGGDRREGTAFPTP